MKKSLLCFSHLRWNFVYQRPQHLMVRFAKFHSVYYFEEPMFDAAKASLTLTSPADNLWVIVPHLPQGMTKEEINESLSMLLDNFLMKKTISDFIFWYYTPMALEFSDKYAAEMVIYDCMDELSAFKFAPKELGKLEKRLFEKADLVFTGGHTLYEAKKNQHDNIFPFPSSIEKQHFEQARRLSKEPSDQSHITGPKIGFYGVIDERFDIDLIGEIARARPEWQIILIGPIVKIDPNLLPRSANIHYLGPKTYAELPVYLSGWDIALIPFLLNESTRYISPTKTPEYLAAGIPVISTAITDVVNPYGKNKLVRIGSNAKDFIDMIDTELKIENKADWLRRVDAFLANNSWDKTFASMQLLTQKGEDRSDISIAS